MAGYHVIFQDRMSLLQIIIIDDVGDIYMSIYCIQYIYSEIVKTHIILLTSQVGMQIQNG